MSRKDPNILHGTRRVRVEVVSKRHKKVCADCAQFPSSRRLLVILGSGRAQKIEVRCIGCGHIWLRHRADEYERAGARLVTGEGSIRS
jgi:RNase P subunit RPR2